MSLLLTLNIFHILHDVKYAEMMSFNTGKKKEKL